MINNHHEIVKIGFCTVMVLCLQGEVLSSMRACLARVFESMDQEDGELKCRDVSNYEGGAFESQN
jgi:hypothetical protein